MDIKVYVKTLHSLILQHKKTSYSFSYLPKWNNKAFPRKKDELTAKEVGVRYVQNDTCSYLKIRGDRWPKACFVPKTKWTISIGITKLTLMHICNLLKKSAYVYIDTHTHMLYICNTY